MPLFAVGKKAVIVVSWQCVRLGASGGKAEEGTGSENHMSNVCDLTGWKKGPVLVTPLCF